MVKALKKINVKHILERKVPAHLLSYQRLPDAGPQHHPTHSLKVHRNMKPLQCREKAKERYSRSGEEEEERGVKHSNIQKEECIILRRREE